MTISTVSIVALQSTGQPLPNGRVTFQLNAMDIVAGIVAPVPVTASLDVNGLGTASLLTNDSGTRGTLYNVEFVDSDGVLRWNGTAKIQGSACNLHDVLNLSPPPALSDALAAQLAAQGYAAQAGAVLTNSAFVAVNGDLPNINAVAGSIAGVNSVAAGLTNVNTVAVIAGNVTTVAGIGANVTTVAGISANVTTVAGIAANVSAVAGDVANINAVAGDLANVDIVAGDKANVDTVAGNVASVNTAATNIVAIQQAPAQAASASQSASQALVIYGTTAAMNAAQQITLGYANTAQSQAQVAQTFAASASSVVQQDLSAVNGAALHRSPNAIVAQTFYDTSRDSDGGAWVDRVTNTSWFNEALNGTWLSGPYSGFASEMDARDWFGIGQNPTTGSLITGDSQTFTNGIGAWGNASACTLASVNGRLRLTATGASPYAGVAVTTVAGQRYRIDATCAALPSGKNAFLSAGTTAGGQQLALVNMSSVGLGSKTISFVATGVTTYVSIEGAGTFVNGDYVEIDNITCTPVSFAANPSGAYYPSNVDGKFYRLWKNLLRNSQNLAGAGWTFQNHSGTATQSGNSFTFTDSSDAVYQSGTGTSIPAGVQLVASAKLSGTGSVRLVVFDGNGATIPAATLNVTLTATPAWYSAAYVTTVAGANGGIEINNLTLGASSVAVAGTQLEYGSVSTAAVSEEVKAADQSQTETFRGNTAKFPRLSAIIAEATNVTIYDLTQPGRPMWMRFKAGANSYVTGGALIMAAPILTSVAANNGILSVADANATDGGLRTINFPLDRIKNQHPSAAFSGTFNGGIAQRNTAGYSLNDGTQPIVNRVVNAVAMTVLPDAPLDPFTLMQVPTIEVLTAGGVSEIKHDGTVVNSALTSAFVSGSITPNGLLAATAAGAVYWAAIPGTLGASFAMTQISTSIPGIAYAAPASSSAVIQPKRQMIVKRAAAGAKVSLVYLNESNPAASPQADITDTYNTGLMLNSVRCWLADTSVGTVSNPTVISDRSPKASIGLTTFGTLAKTLVGGASMYAGWSATNYAQEAYSADLDPGTGGFYVPIGAATIPVGVAAVGWAFDRSAAAGASYKAGHDATGHLTATAFDGTTTRTVTTTAAYNTGTVFSWAVGLSSSGTLTIYVGGKAVASTAGAPLLTLTNASATCTVGIDRGLTAPWSGSLALVKPGMTIPTLEQASFAYEQEKFLFASGAICTLPDAGAVVDMDYDPMMDRLKVVSAANESSWTGLVRTDTAPVSAGSFTKASHRSGIKLLARSTTNPGVDVTIPAYGLREELFNRAYAAAKLARLDEPFDYTGGFTATLTAGSTALTSVAGWTFPQQANPRGVVLSATGIPANAYITDVVGTTVYISAPVTTPGTGVQVAMAGFPLPTGYELKEFKSAGIEKQEGAANYFTRAFDGFREMENTPVSPPGYATWVRLKARRTA